jgi:DNA mismatch repair protein MutL
VHPTKQEVRFVDVRKVFVGVNLPIKQALSAYTENRSQQILTPSMDFNVLDTPPTTAKQSSLPDLYEEFLQPRQQDDVALKMEMDSIVAKNKQRNFEEYCDNLTSFYDKAIKGKPAPEPITDSLATSQSATPIQFHKDYRLMQQIAAEQETFLPTRKQDDEFDFSNVKILGVLFDTYMLIEIGDKAVYIDQHAAHERLLFDKFMENASKLFMQPLMFPYVFTVKDDEAAFIEDNLAEIAKAGILIQPFGQNSFRVVEVASLFTDIKMDKFVNYILGYMDQYKVDSKKLTIDKIAQKACKAAVKAGDKLDSRQLESLVKQIYKNNALQCPHGRPICVEINKAHLEKMFKRIV